MEAIVDIELNQFMLQLSLEQKRSLLILLKSYMNKESNALLMEYNQEIEEANLENDLHLISNEEMLVRMRLWKK